MKKIFWLLTLWAFACTVHAQSAYISYSACDEEDRIADLNGAGGVLILSKRNDLVITVTNASRVRVPAAEKRADGLYEYEVAVDRSETKQPKIEVNRRGDVNRVDWVVSTKPDYLRAYLVEEVQKPIRLEDQTGVDAILDASLAQVEFQSTISNLQIDCPELLSRGAAIKHEAKKGDNSITITQVTIPVKVLDEARERVRQAEAAHEALKKRLLDDPAGAEKATDKDWEQLDQLEAAEREALQDFTKLTHISVYADGTNQLQVDVSGLGPRSKMVYGVLLLKVIEKVHASECAGLLEEGGRQFALREYDAARRAFVSALNAKDTPGDLIPSIQTNIAQCDTCLLYEKYAMGALKKMKDNQVQSEVVKYASAALEFLGVLNRYNPSDFYSSRMEKLNTIIEDQPLSIKFTIVRWENDYSGYREGAPIANVELWAFYGTEPPKLYDYRDEKRFKKMVGSSLYRQVGTSDAQGIAELNLDRKHLPSGIFFRPVGYDKSLQIKYMDTQQIMRQSEGTYDKRQFRLKMYTANKK